MSNETEEQMFDKQTHSIANNILLLVIARVSMALSLPAIGFMGWLYMQWLEQKFADQDTKIIAQTTNSNHQTSIITTRIETVERTAAARLETAEKAAQTAISQSAQVNDRLIAVETKQAQDSVSAERFQNATLQRLDRMQDSLVSVSNAIAALTAVLQAQPRHGNMMRNSEQPEN